MSVSNYQLSEMNIVRNRGFTLIEMIVVMVIAGVLAAIAIPNYSDYVLRSNRSAAQAFISDVASRQSQFFLDRRAYATTLGALNVATPAEVAARYTLAINVVAGPPPTFSITATPAGSQVGDRCGVMTIDQAGAKTAAATRCW